MNSAMEKVAQAAIAWNRARLKRIAVAKTVPDFAIGYGAEEHQFRQARAQEAKAKAVLRKACMSADPNCLVLEVVVHPPKRKLPAPEVIDI